MMIPPLPPLKEPDRLKFRRTGLTLTAPPVRPRTAPVVLHTRVVTGTGGGPDKTILRSAAYANPEMLHIASAYIHPRNDPGIDTLRANAHRHGCSLWSVPESGPADPNTPRRLLKICRQLGVTAWHGHDYKSNALGLLLRRWWPMKLITTVHGWTWDTPRTRLYYHIDTWCLSRYDHVITVSPALTDHCLDHGVAQDRITHIPNAIELDEYQPRQTPHAARVNLGIDPNKRVVGCVGRLSAEKAHDRAIQTIAQLRGQYPDIELHLIGDGPQREALGSLAAELGVSDAVRFWGWQPKPQRFYEAMDLLLLPSHTEGLPNAVLEAMAIGTPVAATDVGAVRQLLDHGHCGVILSQDEHTWPARISNLLVRPELRQHIATLAHTHVTNHYTFKQRMARVFDVYQKVLNTGPLTQITPAATRQAA